MSIDKSTRKDLYYTNDHEWIDFQGSVAYVGVCLFKLTGFKEVQKLIFEESGGLRKKGDLIATIKYKDYSFQVHMPVDGRLARINDTLLADNPDLLLQYAETSAWIAFVVPTRPYERNGLLPPKFYKMNKDKYAK